MRPFDASAGLPASRPEGRMGPKEKRLRAFIREVSRRRFSFGQVDCALTLADWVHVRTGVDLGSAFRGRYRSDSGWRRIVLEAGGLVPLIEAEVRRVGIRGTPRPRPGDIAIVRTRLGETGAIHVGRGWMVKAHHGVAVANFPVVRAWRVP